MTFRDLKNLFQFRPNDELLDKPLILYIDGKVIQINNLDAFDLVNGDRSLVFIALERDQVNVPQLTEQSKKDIFMQYES